MDSTTSSKLVTATLETSAETLGDIVPAVFEQFFAMSEEGRALMLHSDRLMQGRMFEAVLDLLMSDEHFGPDGYLEWELSNHLDAYKATPAMYEAFFSATKNVVRTGVDNWQPEFEDAWAFRINQIMSQVHSHTTA